MAVTGACVGVGGELAAKGFEKRVLEPVLSASPPKGQMFSTALQPLRTNKAALVAAMLMRCKAVVRLVVQGIVGSNR